MEQKTKPSDYKNLLEKICIAMGNKDEAIAKFGKGALNLYHTWEAYHFIDFVEEMFEVNHEVQFNDFAILLHDLEIGLYTEDFRKLPAAKGFTPIRAKKLFKGIEEIRRVRNRRFSERDLLLEFLLFCQKPYQAKNGTKPRVMSIFYGEKLTSNTPIKQNDPVLIEIAQARLNDEINKLKEFCAISEGAAQENCEQATHTSQVETAQENSNVPLKSIEKLRDNRHEVILVNGKDKWLNPYNLNELPLVGREDEIGLLNEFIQADGKFKIWAIAGPSGAGKTRLAIEWASKLDNWTKWVLHKEDRTELDYWNDWSPDNPTLIIIDYMYGFEEVIQILMRNRSKQNIPNIRLLVIDHVFSDDLQRDKRWGLTDEGRSYDQNEKFFFKREPLDLTRKLKKDLETEALDFNQTPDRDQEKIIKEIIAHLAEINVESDQVKEALDYLRDMQGAYYPLFAALVGDAIKSGKYFKEWNRRQLIDYYLSGSDRLPWKYEVTGTKELSIPGRWASYFIAVATARREMSYDDLTKSTENLASAPEYFNEVIKICQTVVTDDHSTVLKPFEPDILGESFFLKFFEFIRSSYSNKYSKEFRQIFMAGSEKTQIKDALDFIAFIQRLTRNLLNDDRKDKETQVLWNTLFNFLNPSDYKDSEVLTWALTAALIDIIDAIKNEFSEEEIILLLNKIDSTVLYCVKNQAFLKESVLRAMCYFELTYKFTGIIPTLSEEMTLLFDRYAISNIEDETPLITACYYGFNKILTTLLQHGIDKEAVFYKGQNALIVASAVGNTEAVNQLLDADVDINIVDDEGYSALIWASMKGNSETVRVLLNRGAKVDGRDKAGNTALIRASIGSQLEIIKLLLDKEADIDASNYEGRTALMMANFFGHIETVKLLLNRSADLNALDNYRRSAFSLACSKGHNKLVQILVDHVNDINIADIEGKTPLIWSSYHGHVETVRLLLDKGAEIDKCDTDGRTSLIWASGKGHLEIVKLLVDRGANIFALDNEEHTAHFYAFANHHNEVVEFLQEKLTNINTIDSKGNTALIWSSSRGEISTVKILLSKGADTNFTNKEKRTALAYASSNGHTEILALLLYKGAKIDATDIEGHTALMYATSNGHIETVKLLLSEKANVHLRDNKNFTALLYASFQGHTEIVKLLLDKNADIDAADYVGSTPLSWAICNNHIETAKFLVYQGADIDVVDNKGVTSLMWACVENNIEVVELLVSRNARIDLVANQGWTALSLAQSKGYKEIVQLLLDHGAEN